MIGESSHSTVSPPEKLYPSPDGAQVLLQVYFDADGVPIFPMFAGGTWQLKDAAIEAAMKWRLKPVRINGAPIFDWAMVAIDFAKR
jgi:hypothetical protein